MKKIKTIRFISIALLVCTANSCGIVSKARYGNGFKLNLWEVKAHETGNSKPEKPASKTRFAGIRPVPVTDSFTGAAISGPLKCELTLLNSESQPGKSINNAQANITNSFHHYEKIRPQNNPSQSPVRPMEPVTKKAGILFYGGLALSYIAEILGVLTPFLASVIGLAIIAGFVLAWIGLSNIRQSNNAYAGKGLAISIIVLYILAIIYVLLVFALLLLILSL